MRYNFIILILILILKLASQLINESSVTGKRESNLLRSQWNAYSLIWDLYIFLGFSANSHSSRQAVSLDSEVWLY